MILTDLLNNPLMAIVVIIVAIIIGKLLNISFKILKWIVLIGIAYFVVTALGIF